MRYTHNQTIKNREICMSVMETVTPTDDPYWIEISGDIDPIYREYKDGQYIELSREELQELFSE